MFGVGGWELFIIFMVILLFFGARRLPEIARAMGKSVNEFRKAKDEFTNYMDEKPVAKTAAPSTEPRQLPEDKLERKDAEKQP